MSTNPAAQTISKTGKKAAISVIRAYKTVVSPFVGRSCRFIPSCSQYAEEAIERYGVLVGTRRSLWRILRCNPFSQGGYDPVEGKEQHKEE